MKTLGLVAIGRNEGERLRNCLTSALAKEIPVVYVDSGSTDGSAEMARSMGADVVDLDLSIPFTAARARNAGFDRLRTTCPEIEFVQFLDGDCELIAEWLDRAVEFLNSNTKVAIAAGRVRERFPEASLYNRLCDLEWQTPIGETHWCGGNVLIRAAALLEAGGFNAAFIAGEEPELCVRLREKGWTIHRLDADVAWHDAAMKRFGQWWRRATRNGFACAEGARLHGWRPERYWVREVRSGWVWGAAVPIVALSAAWPTRGWSIAAAVALYGLLFARVLWNLHRRGAAKGKLAWIAAGFIVLAKFPQAIGQCRFWATRLRGRRSPLIEYKSSSM
jgi:glycosyltransferase involved in cell wall biosynthesis